MNQRLESLEKLTSSDKADAFAWYGLAMEYKAAGRIDDAERAFTTLREKHPDYVPMYLMAGSMLVDAGRGDDARGWLEEGMERATAAGNAHARDAMKGLLAKVLGGPRGVPLVTIPMKRNDL